MGYLRTRTKYIAPLTAAKRSVINMNSPAAGNNSVNEYLFIDHMLASAAYGPASHAFGSGASWMTLIDAVGQANNAAADGQFRGGSLMFPGSDQFTGTYVLTWTGSGNFAFNTSPHTITFTEQNTTAAGFYSKNGNGSWKGQGPNVRIEFKLVVSSSTGPIQFAWYSSETGGVNGFMTNLKLFRLEDETRLNSGKMFRLPALQLYADLNPGIIRFMDWCNVNNDHRIRWSHRTLPSFVNWAQVYPVGPKYGATTGTNRLTLASVTGTPGTMQHGEIVTCRLGSTGGTVFAKQQVVAINTISKAATGIVTTQAAHGYATNDIIVHNMMDSIPGQAPRGMVELQGVPCKIVVTSTTQYELHDLAGVAINTTSFSNPILNDGFAYPYNTLNVGGRGEYPMVKNDGIAPIVVGIPSNALETYGSFVFDKHVKGVAPVTGAWIATGNLDVIGGVPVEICTTFINELNEIKTGTPTHMWINLPGRGMSSSSYHSDYSAADNWGVNMVDAVLNPASTQRAAGYSELQNGALLFVEHCNETWNDGMKLTLLMMRLGFQNFPALGFHDMDTMSSIEAVRAIRDIKAASIPNISRARFVLGAFGTYGNSGGNLTRINGNATYTAQVDSATPLSNFDYLAWAAYFDTGNGTWDPANLSTMANTWNSHAGNAVQQEADCAAYVQGLLYIAQGGQETVEYYIGKISDFGGAVSPQSRKQCMYEGGWNHATVTGDGNWNGAWDANPNIGPFLIACKRSQAWAVGMRVFFDAWNARIDGDYPADYIMVGHQYGHTDARKPGDTYAGGVEGANLDNAWIAMKARNNGLPYP